MRLKSALISLLFFLLVIPSVFAQSSAQLPTFKSKAELVLVPTVVTDKSGQHIPGLKASDFSLLQDKNKTPRIAFCEEITHTSRTDLQPVALPPETFTNVVSKTQSPKNVVVIAIDTINTPFADQASARRGVIKYLSESVPPDTPIALLFMTTSGVRMLHDFTTDSATLIAALQSAAKGKKTSDGLAFPKATTIAALDNEASLLSKFETDGYVVEVSPREIDLAHQSAVLDTTTALSQIAHAYSGVPGRKALVWVTSGVPQSIELALAVSQTNNPIKSHETDVSAEFERAWKDLNDANFAVYAVDATGLFTGRTYSGVVRPSGSVWSGGSPQAHRTASNPIPLLVHQETFNTLETISKMTGGRAFLNTNDLAKGIHSAINDSENYYLLGFYLESPAIAPGWHTLKVTTPRKNLSIRSREGFFVSRTPVGSADRITADLSLALRSPVQFSGLPLMLRWQQSPQDTLEPAAHAAPSAKKRINFDLVVASNAIKIDEESSRAVEVNIVGVAQDSAGDKASTVQQVIKQKLTSEAAANLRKNGLLYRGIFQLAPGTYTVHLAVRDNLNGKLGSIIAPLKVE